MTRRPEDAPAHAPTPRRSCVEFGWPPCPAPRLLVRHQDQVQACEIVADGQRCSFGPLRLANDLTMCSDKAADRGVGEHVLVLGLPAKQVGNRAKRQLLRQQAGPFLEATGDDDALVWRKNRVAGDHMGLHLGMRTDLARQREGTEAARDRDGLVPVTVNWLRGKKTGGAGPSGRHQ